MRNNFLSISEMFFSHQGEGHTAGRLAFFIRLAGCNLTCGISKESLKEAKKLNLTQEKINQLKKDDADWVCDSIFSWIKGKNLSFEEILEVLNEMGFTKAIKNGAHLIITGGEPLQSQGNVLSFLKFLSEKGINPTIEIETNGTILPVSELNEYINYWNVSPKLSGSGMTKEQRFNSIALRYFNVLNKKSMFKFVISRPKDILEIKELISLIEIDKRKVWLMPAASSIDELLKLNKTVAELALKNEFNFSSRLQVEVYNQTLGV